MKKTMMLMGIALSSSYVFGQVGINSATPNPSSILTVAPTDINGKYKGTLFGPMATDQISKIVNPATGLVVYDWVQRCLKVNKGTPSVPRWVCIITK